MSGVPWSRAIVVGASSGIGAALARDLARAGCRVALVARREAELARVAGEIGTPANGEGLVRTYPHDVTRYGDVPALFQQVCRDLGGLDLIVYAAGVMPRIGDDEYTFAKDRETVEVNVLGAIAWLNEAADRFARAGAGTIVGISSVAGDRGRSGNPVYCASKAALDTYLESLRNRIGRLGVRVVTVKPGPVATPMTQGLSKLPFLISADEASRTILAAAARGTRTVYVPARWWPIMLVIRSIPSPLFQRLNI
jgi:NAD(P)-dependent dehydrogenase (short-subunit alcohol dehydrogenase family)